MIKTSVISSTGKDRGQERRTIISNLLEAVKICQTRYGSRNELATESDSQVFTLCQSLEELLNHGLRSKPQLKKPNALNHMTDLVTNSFKHSQDSSCFWQFVKTFLTRHEIERWASICIIVLSNQKG